MWKTNFALGGIRTFCPRAKFVLFSHFTLLEWNVKNCFVKLIKTLKINRKNYFVWNDDILCRVCIERKRYSDRLRAKGLENEVADDASVLHMHARPESVEDPSHTHRNLLLFRIKQNKNNNYKLNSTLVQYSRQIQKSFSYEYWLLVCIHELKYE